ncbi:uncharacterized protein LY89DRAFT_108819 [Mollisia scopiformis]|uniref:Uncharacterized protein n=1 Tax=Mollisia scopiformis TaxID=149040 RepID=A0A194X549_MOLSC|nr:uncharacterized protein LY89DRAFT_108819 [Mollisia scopiformis]KUJ15306.1 hypothetical protein LY89DRAFT_108819 [Mollisia scopiformis]
MRQKEDHAFPETATYPPEAVRNRPDRVRGSVAPLTHHTHHPDHLHVPPRPGDPPEARRTAEAQAHPPVPQNGRPGAHCDWHMQQWPHTPIRELLHSAPLQRSARRRGTTQSSQRPIISHNGRSLRVEYARCKAAVWGSDPLAAHHQRHVLLARK